MFFVGIRIRVWVLARAKDVLSNTFFQGKRGKPSIFPPRERGSLRKHLPHFPKEGEGEDILQRGGSQLGWDLRAMK